MRRFEVSEDQRAGSKEHGAGSKRLGRRNRRARSSSPLCLKSLITLASLVTRTGNYPVFLPRLARICRERLFENRAVFRDIRVGVADENVFSVEQLLIKELAATIFEPAYRRRHTDNAVAAGGPIQVPLMVFRIIEAQTQTFQAPSWSFHLHFDKVGAAIPERSDIGSAVIF